MKALGCGEQLTIREHQVLEYIADGYSAKEIAIALHIAPRTVERHTENVRMKMRARNRAQMIANAVKIGSLTIPLDNQAEICFDCLFHGRRPAFSEAALAAGGAPIPAAPDLPLAEDWRMGWDSNPR